MTGRDALSVRQAVQGGGGWDGRAILDKERLESLFREHGFEDFTWIDPGEIVVAQWVRMKCRHGCDGFGSHPMCPPNALPVAECRQFLGEYTSGVVFHLPRTLSDPKERHEWLKKEDARLLRLERAVFLEGHVKAFALFSGSCHLCADCPDTTTDCMHPELARPTPEALGVDVFSTVRNYGLPIEVLKTYDEAMNRYSFLLVE